MTMQTYGKSRSKYLMFGLLFALFLILLLIDILFHNQFLRQIARNSLNIKDHGMSEIAKGARHVVTEFNVKFESPPVVTVTPLTLQASEFAVTEVSTGRFKIELNNRAANDIEFSWQATWDIPIGREFANEREGMTESLAFEWDNENYQATYTGYYSYRPTEFWIADITYQKIAENRETFLVQLLDAARQTYNSRFFCNWWEHLKYKVGQRFLACPDKSRQKNYLKWHKIDTTLWHISHQADGVRVFTNADSTVNKNINAEHFARLFSKVKTADIAVHNNQLLDFVEEISNRGDSTQLTLLHFDTHSDLYFAKDPRMFQAKEMIGDFINTLLVQSDISEVYWVLPDWTQNAGFKKTYWDKQIPEMEANEFATPYLEGPKTLDVFIDLQSKIAYFENLPKTIAKESVRQVKIHKVLLEEIPVFKSEDKILLEFDADYFSNSGYDTTLAPAFNPSIEELNYRLNWVVDALLEKNILPEYFFLCLSPKYVTVEDQSAIFGYLAQAMQANGLNDLLVGYRHNIENGFEPFSKNVLRVDSLQGLIFELLLQDSAVWPGDQRVFINDNNVEYRQLIATLMRTYSIDDYHAENIALQLDLFDGERDRIINLIDLEYYIAKEKLIDPLNL